MKEIGISEFRAKCGALLKEVYTSKQPLRVMRRGKPLVEIVPPTPVSNRRNFLGSGRETFDILDHDIVGPIIDFT